MYLDDDKLKAAFENPKYIWRTVQGIAKETGLTNDLVTEYIFMHSDFIVRSSSKNKNGEQLFASRKIYRNKASFFRRISSAVKNRGG